MSSVKPTYTKKQVAIALLPWSIIVTMVLVSTGAFIGWTLRSNFYSEISQQVSSIVEAKTNAKPVKSE